MPRLYFLSSATCTWAVRGMRTTNLLRSNSGHARQEQSDRGDVEGAAEESCCGEQGILPLLSGGKMREPVPARGHQRPSSPRRPAKVVDGGGAVAGAAGTGQTPSTTKVWRGQLSSFPARGHQRPSSPRDGRGTVAGAAGTDPAAGSRPPIVSAAPGDATKTTPPPPPPTAAPSSTLTPSSVVPPPPTANSTAPPEHEAETKPPPSSVNCGGEGSSTDAAQPPATDVPTSVAPTDNQSDTTSSAPPTTGAAETETPKKTTSTSTTTKDPRPSIEHLAWEKVALTQYWDCSTMGWDCNNVRAAPQHGPYKPRDDEKTEEYQEDFWMTGAASDSLVDRGNKCYLVQTTNGNNNDLRVIVALNNKCPGQYNDVCARPQLHIDIAAPGYDCHAFSKSQKCAEPGQMGQLASGAICSWQLDPEDPAWKGTTLPACGTGCDKSKSGYHKPKEERQKFYSEACQRLPPQYHDGCLNFAKWDWTDGGVEGRFFRIDCPQKVRDHVQCPL